MVFSQSGYYLFNLSYELSFGRDVSNDLGMKPALGFVEVSLP